MAGPLIIIVPKMLGQRMKKGPGLEQAPSDSSSIQSGLRKSDSPSSLSRFSFKKVQSWNFDIPFMGPCTGKAYLKDSSLRKFSPKSNELPMDTTTETSSVVNDWLDDDDDDEKVKDKEGDKKACVVDSISASTNSSGTVIDCPFEEMSEDEFPEHPIICDSRVQVIDDYYVKRSLSSTMRSILNKHGDIAQNCKLSSVVMRSYYLECLCFIVRELRSHLSVDKTSKAKLKEMMTILNDVEVVGIEVGWLREIISEIKEEIELVKKGKSIEDERKKRESEMEFVRRNIVTLMQDLEHKKKGITDAMAEVEEAQGWLGKLEEERSRLDATILLAKSKIESIDYHGKIDEIL
ncbi:hypothetical protein SAY87_002722 [Trapa incisa]|uniref:Phospholipase-like protein n=1 Tax=Trapa incisa TaxID=236973 RepID=A0AAN7JUG1_9MYRT|nr:hypothetical protein SAY87_002722 [Trapa incisa]